MPTKNPILSPSVKFLSSPSQNLSVIPSHEPTSPTASSTGCGVGINIETIDFEDGSVGNPPALNLTGSGNNDNPNPRRPWVYNDDAFAACDGSLGLTAGGIGSYMRGVDFLTVLTVAAPIGSTSVQYFYSHPAITGNHRFEVSINGGQLSMREYGIAPFPRIASCEADCIPVSSGDLVQFTCAGTSNRDICSIDNIQFIG